MGDAEKGPSLSRSRRGITVAASPFNMVKLELAFILICAVLLFIIHKRLVADSFGQLLLLAGYGVGAAFWLSYRVRKVSRQQFAGKEQESDGKEE